MPLSVRELAEELLPAAPVLAEGMATHLLATIPEIDAGDDDLRDETRASCEANISQAALEAIDSPEGIRVAVGTAGDGLAGFRRSHDEAVQAAHVASLARGELSAVTSYKRVELVSLLASDLPRARTFVAGRLGPLAAPDDSAARLRDTVLAFLAAGGSSTRVAKQLYIHHNTVAYRVKRAEELLGRRVTEDPIELTCALTLASVLGPAVLVGEDAPDDAGSMAPSGL
jgi:DNA-binding PucR family transcriptional regulator